MLLSQLATRFQLTHVWPTNFLTCFQSVIFQAARAFLAAPSQWR